MRFAIDLVTEGPHHPLLTAVVLPTVEDVEEASELHRFFFTRLPDGAGLRLHWIATDEASAPALRKAVDAALQRHLDESDSAAVPRQAEDDPPDAERFGGPVGLELCERQFELSSRAVLSAMVDGGDWDPQQALGAALPLHLGFAAASGFDRRQAAAFFRDLAERRFPDGDAEREEMTDEFETVLASQRAEIEPVVDLIWATFAADDALGVPWADRFYLAMRNVTDELLQATRDERLELVPEHTWPDGDRLGTPCWQFGGLLFDQVHGTDRRLGLGGADEIYLSHLLAELLRPGPRP